MKLQKSLAMCALGFVFLVSTLSGCSESSTSVDSSSDRINDTEEASTDATQPKDTTEHQNSEPTGENQESSEETQTGSWTILVYIMGDTDLEEFALSDLVEMSKVPTSEEFNIVALFDRSDIHSEAGVLNLEDFSDTKILQIKNGALNVVNDSIGELNLGDSETLASFIEFGFSEFPAERTALILWDHGAGWPGMGPDDGNDFDILDLQEISEGLEQGLESVEIEKLDLIGFDACLMGTYEVAIAMEAYADVMVASQELEPGHGWDWEVLNVVASDPSIDAPSLGMKIADAYKQHAIDHGTETEITLSVIDLAKIVDVRKALQALEIPLVSQSDDLASKLGIAQSKSLRVGKNPDPSLDAQMLDLGSLAVELGEVEPDLLDLTNDLVAALEEAVIGQVTGPATKSATGLAIYFPKLESFSNEGYFYLQGITGWQNILISYFEAQQNIPENEQAEFVTEPYSATYALDADEGLEITAQFNLAAQDNLTEAVIYYGLPEEDGSILFLGEEAAEILTDGSGVAFGFWDLTVLTMSDGVDTVYAYTQLYIDEDAQLYFLDIPLTYVPPESSGDGNAFYDVVLSVTIDIASLEILSEIYYSTDQSGQWGELVADPEGLIYPVFLFQNADFSLEWIEINDVGLWADIPTLQYFFEPLESETGFVAELWVFDYGGNSDYVYVEDYIP